MIPRRALLAGVIGVAVLTTGAALADEFSDVQGDYQGDGQITPCRFTKGELLAAKQQAQAYPDSLYTGFLAEIDQEVARWDSGGCTGVAQPPPAGNTAVLRIVKVKARGTRGKPRSEYVTIRNVGRRAVALGGLALRNRLDKGVRLPRTARLRAGRRLRVVTGCFKARRKPVRRGNRFFACRKRGQLWNNSGDVVKLVNARGVVLAQLGYKRFRRVPRF